MENSKYLKYKNKYFKMKGGVWNDSIKNYLKIGVNMAFENNLIESLVVNNYREIVDDLRQEITRMKDRISDVEKKERLYIEQSNLLIKDKQELSIRILQLEKDNKYLFEENVKLKKALQDLNINK